MIRPPYLQKDDMFLSAKIHAGIQLGVLCGMVGAAVNHYGDGHVDIPVLPDEHWKSEYWNPLVEALVLQAAQAHEAPISAKEGAEARLLLLLRETLSDIYSSEGASQGAVKHALEDKRINTALNDAVSGIMYNVGRVKTIHKGLPPAANPQGL